MFIIINNCKVKISLVMNFLTPETLKQAEIIKDALIDFLDFLIDNKDIFEKLKNYLLEKNKKTTLFLILKAIEERLNGNLK